MAVLLVRKEKERTKKVNSSFAYFYLLTHIKIDGLVRLFDLPSSNNVICESSKKILSVKAPSNRNSSRRGRETRESLLGLAEEAGGALIESGDEISLLKIPNLDSFVGRSDEPVVIGGKGEGVDGVSSIEGVEQLLVVDVPKMSKSVLATRGTERSVGRDGDGVDVSGVSSKDGLLLELMGIKDSDSLVTSSRDKEGLVSRGREANAGDPSVGFKVELALTKGIPDLYSLVTRCRDDLSVVGRKGNAHNVLGVTNKGLVADTLVHVPKTDGVVPRGREGELGIDGKCDVLNGVGVAGGEWISTQRRRWR